MNPIIEPRGALTLKTLLNHFQDYLRDGDYQDYASYSTHKLKAKLLKHCGKSLTISDESNNQQPVFSSVISMADVINIL